MKTAMQVLVALIMAAGAGAVIWRWEINGWGSLVWLSLMVILPAIRAPYLKQTKQNTITEKRKTTIESTLLVLTMVGNGFLPIAHLATGMLSFANYDLPHLATGAGAAILIPAVWLFWRSHADLGRNWSVTTELREDHTLVTSGVYKYIRHPMYSAIWLISLAVPLLIHNWIAGFSSVVTFALLYFIRVPYEEKMMREQFGEEYDRFCERAGRLWPK